MVGLATDLLALLEPYAIRSVYTSEPRYYRTGLKGRSLLMDAIRAGRAHYVSFRTEPGASVATTASASLVLGGAGDPSAPSIEIGMELPTDDAVPGSAGVLRDFVTRWFGRLNAAASFVSTSPGDAASFTAHERAVGQGKLAAYRAVTRYARGVFWGNGLGPDLCDRLGGREGVCREAPTAIARPLGDGVWLQLADLPPAPEEASARLADFLAPLLTWTLADIVPSDEEAARLRANVGHTPPASAPVTPSPSSRVSKSRREMVPARVLADVETQMALNVYLEGPPTNELSAALKATVQEWYQEGFDGAFLPGTGGGGFHFLRGPTVDGSVVRWFVDIGPSDQRSALRALRRRLAGVPDVHVVRLVIGTEHAR